MDFTYYGVENGLTKVPDGVTESYTYVTGTNRLQEVAGPVAYTYDAGLQGRSNNFPVLVVA